MNDDADRARFEQFAREFCACVDAGAVKKMPAARRISRRHAVELKELLEAIAEQSAQCDTLERQEPDR